MSSVDDAVRAEIESFKARDRQCGDALEFAADAIVKLRQACAGLSDRLDETIRQRDRMLQALEAVVSELKAVVDAVQTGRPWPSHDSIMRLDRALAMIAEMRAAKAVADHLDEGEETKDGGRR